MYTWPDVGNTWSAVGPLRTQPNAQCQVTRRKGGKNQDPKRLVLGAGIGKEENLGCQEAIAMAEGILGGHLASLSDDHSLHLAWFLCLTNDSCRVDK